MEETTRAERVAGSPCESTKLHCLDVDPCVFTASPSLYCTVVIITKPRDKRNGILQEQIPINKWRKIGLSGF